MPNKKRFYLKYKNPDKRCTYPFENNLSEYCWGYAESIDYKDPLKETQCKGCLCWKEKNK